MNNKKREIDPAIKSKVTAFLANQKAHKSNAKKVNAEEDIIKSDNKENISEVKSDINTQLSDVLTIDWCTALEDIKNCLIHSLGLKSEADRVQWFKDFAGYEGKLKNAPTDLFEKVYKHFRDSGILTNVKIYLHLKPLIEVRIKEIEDNSVTKEIKSDINNQTISDTNINEGFELTSDEIKIKPQSSTIDDSYQLIENNEDLEKAIAFLKDEKVLGIDTETTGLDAHIHKLRLIQIASNNHLTIIIDCFKCDAKLIQPLLINDSIKVFHNAKFDLKFFLALGLEINQSLFDTMLSYQLINAGKPNLKSSLKEVAKELLNIELNKDEQVSQWSNIELTESQLKYSAIDSKILLLLREKLRGEIVSAILNEIAKIEFDCVLAVAIMEFNGMLLDLAQWQEIIEKIQLELTQLNSEIQKLLPKENTLFPIDINLNSNQELKEVLNKMGINVKNVKSETLEPFALTHPEIIIPLLKYKKINHFSTHFGDKLIKKIHPITGRIHTEYKQLGAQSGRFSSVNPNIQQIPKDEKFRSCFVATPNHKLVIADYSQFQIRIGAEISNDETLIKAIKDNTDLHKLTASLVLDKPLETVTKEDRQLAKAINFGILFGLGANGLRTNLKVSYGIEVSESEAKGFIDKFLANYKGVGKLTKDIKTKLKFSKILTTRTLANRIRHFEYGSGYTTALNTPVQGSEADILKLALGKLVSALKPYGNNVKLLATVHDEIILEAHESIASEVAKVLSEVMIEAGKKFLKRVPIEADSSIGNNWSEK